MPTFCATEDEKVLGFLTIKEHFPEAAEIHVMAVRAEHQRRGIGHDLVDVGEEWLRERGCRFLQVKTISQSHSSVPYAQTRAFYLKNGFVPLEEFPTLWHEANPCLLLIRHL